MSKFFLKLMAIGVLMFFTSGCALIGTALTAGIGYGIYKATKH